MANQYTIQELVAFVRIQMKRRKKTNLNLDELQMQ